MYNRFVTGRLTVLLSSLFFTQVALASINTVLGKLEEKIKVLDHNKAEIGILEFSSSSGGGITYQLTLQDAEEQPITGSFSPNFIHSLTNVQIESEPLNSNLVPLHIIPISAITVLINHGIGVPVPNNSLHLVGVNSAPDTLWGQVEINLEGADIVAGHTNNNVSLSAFFVPESGLISISYNNHHLCYLQLTAIRSVPKPKHIMYKPKSSDPEDTMRAFHRGQILQ